MSAIFYTKDDFWAEIGDDGLAAIGLAARAIATLGGAVTALELPEPGRSVVKGESCGAVKAGEARLELRAPLTGMITETNAALAEQPALLGRDTQTGWVFKLRLADPGAFTELMDQPAYDAFTAGH